MSKREQYAGQGESAILAKELQVNLRVYSTVGQVAEAGGGGRSIDWGSAATYRAGATDAGTIELCYTGNHFDLIWRGLNPPAAEPLRE